MAFQPKDWTLQGYERLAGNVWMNPEGFHFSEVDGILRKIDNISGPQAQRYGVTPEQHRASTEHNKTLQESLLKKGGAQKKLEEAPLPAAQAAKQEPGADETPPEEEGAQDTEVEVPVEESAPEERAPLAIRADIVRPLVTVAEATRAFNEYIKLTKAILQNGDYMNIRGKMFKKKSAWRKYERFFGLSVPLESVRMVQEHDEKGRIIKAEVWLEMVAPNGRRSPGYACCSLHERSHHEDKTRWDDKRRERVVECKGPCDGRVHYSHPEHDIPATAMTRARNRACSDMIGAGEVSAEEVKEG